MTQRKYRTKTGQASDRFWETRTGTILRLSVSIHIDCECWSRFNSSDWPAVNSSSHPRTSFPAGVFAGLVAYLRVPATLHRYRLWHYLLAPALVSLVLSLIILAVVILAAIGLSGIVDQLVEVSVGWLDELINWIVGILMAFAMLAAFVFLHRRIVLIVLSPLLARLAELTVRGMEGEQFEATLDFATAFQRGLHY